MERKKIKECHLECRYARSLIEASPDPLIVIGNDGKITDMNEANEGITGIDYEKIIGTDFSGYFTEPRKAIEVFLAIFEKGSVSDAPLTFCHKNGNLTDVLFNGSVYKDDFGNVAGAVLVARDTAEHKWLKELRNVNQELKFQNAEIKKQEIVNKELEALSCSLKLSSQYSLSLIEAIHEPLFTVNPDGKITDLNHATVQATGLPREELVGKDFFECFTDHNQARECHQQAFSKGFIVNFPLTLQTGRLQRFYAMDLCTKTTTITFRVW